MLDVRRLKIFSAVHAHRSPYDAFTIMCPRAGFVAVPAAYTDGVTGTGMTDGKAMPAAGPRAVETAPGI